MTRPKNIHLAKKFMESVCIESSKSIVYGYFNLLEFPNTRYSVHSPAPCGIDSSTLKREKTKGRNGRRRERELESSHRMWHKTLHTIIRERKKGEREKKRETFTTILLMGSVVSQPLWPFKNAFDHLWLVMSHHDNHWLSRKRDWLCYKKSGMIWSPILQGDGKPTS